MLRRQTLSALILPLMIGGSFFVLGCSQGPTVNPAGGASSSKLNGGGSSFVNPMMQDWASLYKNEKGVQVNYQSIGSGAGIQKMTAQEIDFGCTDAPLTKEQLNKAEAKGGQVIHVPLVMGAVVPAYHLSAIAKALRFTGPVLADIYLGKIKKWNDPALTELNPGVALPDLDIAVVHRADSSGTTFIWVDYLAKVSPEWKEKVGVGTSVKWPVGVGQKNSEGVSGHIERTEGAIGYIELLYAMDKKGIQFGSVKNRAGTFIEANLASVTAAAKGALKTIPADLRYSLTDTEGQEAFPICGTTWAVLYEKQPEGKGPAVAAFLRWITHEGQDKTEALHYARLPPDLVERVNEKLAAIK